MGEWSENGCECTERFNASGPGTKTQSGPPPPASQPGAGSPRPVRAAVNRKNRWKPPVFSPSHHISNSPVGRFRSAPEVIDDSKVGCERPYTLSDSVNDGDLPSNGCFRCTNDFTAAKNQGLTTMSRVTHCRGRHCASSLVPSTERRTAKVPALRKLC